MLETAREDSQVWIKSNGLEDELNIEAKDGISRWARNFVAS